MKRKRRPSQRLNLVERAEEWRWSSLWRRVSGGRDAPNLLHAWPQPVPRGWSRHVNLPQSEAEQKALRHAVHRGTPFGGAQCQVRAAKRLGLEWTLRPRGRLRKMEA